MDVRAEDRIGPRDAEAFHATQEACEQVGWSFARVGEPGRVLVANVRWLARYRHPRCGARADVAEELLEAFLSRRPLFDGIQAVGDRLVVLPVLFHLLWLRVLHTDVQAELLGPGSLVSTRATT